MAHYEVTTKILSGDDDYVEQVMEFDVEANSVAEATEFASLFCGDDEVVGSVTLVGRWDTYIMLDSNNKVVVDSFADYLNQEVA